MISQGAQNKSIYAIHLSDICRVQLAEFRNSILAKLQALPDQGEAVALTREIIFHLIHQRPPYSDSPEISATMKEEADRIVERLLSGEPFQYITGKALFLDLELFVNSSVLIPRPETAELVELILEETEHAPSRIIDLGTGSGCLAIALARKYRQARVTACDVSLEALATAKSNSDLFAPGIDFQWNDMNSAEFFLQSGKYDLIVSNPPYIAENEAQAMTSAVLDYEPRLALFAPPDDPLHFYRRIAAFSIQNLERNGAVWLEINPLFADETSEIFKRAGMKDVRIYADLSGKDRFVAAFS